MSTIAAATAVFAFAFAAVVSSSTHKRPTLLNSKPPDVNPCFADSRRLTGPNRYFNSTGAVLDVVNVVENGEENKSAGGIASNVAAHKRWRDAVRSVCAALGWGDPRPAVQSHASGTILALAAPADQLFTATEINEWAWEQASGIFFAGMPSRGTNADGIPFDQIHNLGADMANVVSAFQSRAMAESNGTLAEIRAAAVAHGLLVLVDDDNISIGAGSGSQTWPLTALPTIKQLAWPALHNIPIALVTGSNGKTTVVRLLASILKASGKRVGYSSTEGVMIDGREMDSGDFSGPAGARLVLRDKTVEAGALETARGGILRRGLATEHADVAVITNISADHFGEYGIDNLDDLADVKLTVARTLGEAGTLVLNADDPVLLARAAAQKCKVALFAYNDSHPSLVAHREAGGTTCGVMKSADIERGEPAKNDQLMLSQHGERVSLGAVFEFPLTMNGAAIYNVGNIAAAALAAIGLGVPTKIIAAELRRFGRVNADNPGRFERWYFSNLTIIIDYAHNPSGIALLMAASSALQREQDKLGSRIGRIGLLLGQAGNRADDAIKQLAEAVATFAPDVIVLKELDSMLRGREPGEVPQLLHAALVAAGFPHERIINNADASDEVDSARQLLEWAQPHDVLVMPIHQQRSRAQLATLLHQLQAMDWRAGSALPARL